MNRQPIATKIKKLESYLLNIEKLNPAIPEHESLLFFLYGGSTPEQVYSMYLKQQSIKKNIKK